VRDEPVEGIELLVGTVVGTLEESRWERAHDEPDGGPASCT
jgi:hypothetical protein